jgi:hypothetical protein
MALLREIGDENAYQRHLAAHGQRAFRRGVAALLGRADAGEVCEGEVLLK